MTGETSRKEFSRRKLRTFEKVNLWLSRLIIWVAIALALFPAAWVVTASLQPGEAFFSESLIPEQLTFKNYLDLFAKTDFPLWVKNSLILCTGVATIQLLFTLPAAYAFSRLRFVGRRYGLMTLLILQMFPASMALPAIYTLLAKLNLLDNMLGAILAFSGSSAFNIWLLKGYIDSLPRELDEAALADGATRWQIFTRIILPLSRPMLAVMFLFAFIGQYSEYMLTSIILQSPLSYTVAVGLQRFITNQFSARWNQFAAAAVVASLPLVIIFMLLQKYVEAGLTKGAIKG